MQELPSRLNTEAIAKQLAQTKILSLDVFDTALVRNVARPTDLFVLVEEQMGNRVRGFTTTRVQAEQMARRRSRDNAGTGEVCLEEIYDCLIDIQPEWINLRSLIQETELELETATIAPNPAIRKWQDVALANNLWVIFVSDMYLPHEYIEDLLKRNGYGPFRRLYVSSSLGKSKAEGNLYDYICDDLQVDPEDILHIGDNHWSDIVCARRHRWRALHIRQPMDLVQSDARFSGLWKQYLRKARSQSSEKSAAHPAVSNSTLLQASHPKPTSPQPEHPEYSQQPGKGKAAGEPAIVTNRIASLNGHSGDAGGANEQARSRTKNTAALAVGAAMPPGATSTPKSAEPVFWGTLSRRFLLQELREEIWQENFWSDFGYAIAGPIQYGFLHWLVQEAKALGVQNLLFMARDGFMMKRVYDAITENDPDAPKSHYLLTSRRALNFASMKDLNTTAMDFLLEGRCQIPLHVYLERIGLNPRQYVSVVRSHGFSDLAHIVSMDQDRPALESLFRDLEQDILSNVRIERDAYLAYLRQQRIDGMEQFAIVDVGWKCSMHLSLIRLLGRICAESEIPGFYFGTFPQAAERINPNLLHSYLFHLGIPDEMYQAVRNCIEIVELFFASSQKGLVRMDLDKDSGMAHPIFHRSHEHSGILQDIACMHAGAECFVRDFLSIYKCAGPGLPRQLVFDLLQRFLTQPTVEEVVEIGNLEHSDGFGECSIKRPLARPGHWPAYMRNPARLKSDYKSCYWRRGFYTRLTPMQKAMLWIQMPRLNFERL